MRKVAPNDIETIAEAEAILAEVTDVELRRCWSNMLEPACPLCETRSWEGRPHRRTTHELLLARSQRRLPRRHPSAKIRHAERRWRKATGESIKMEDLLERELVRDEKPAEPAELAEVLGVRPGTIRKWARWLGLQLPPTD